MALVPRAAPARRALLPMEDELLEKDLRGRPRFAPTRRTVSPDLHAANARFTDAILGTGDYDDAARTALSDLAWRGETAAPGFHDLLSQLQERDPAAAAAFAGSVRRVAEQRPSAPSGPERPREPTAPTFDVGRTVAHYLFPGQVASKDENPWLEGGADLIPFVGNIRSASYAVQDIKDAGAAFREGEYLTAAGRGALALFDAAGAIPAAGNLLAAGKPFIRNAIRATPGLRRAHASWTLAKEARQFDNPIKVGSKALYGEFWPKLPPHQQMRLESLQKHIIGKGGEAYNDELLASSGFHRRGDGKILWGNPTGKTRNFDAETVEKFDTIFFGLFAVPGKTSESRMLYELKTAGGDLKNLQKEADKIISQSETIQYLRLHLDEVPFEFLAAQTRKFLQKPGSPFAAHEVEELVKSMQRARTPEGKPLTMLDWLMGVARIGAEAVRSDDAESN
jgi:hypothetical protein